MNIPSNLKYTESHEWVSLNGDIATVGITDHAQHELSDVVYVQLPQVGVQVNAKEAIAVVESVKAASDIYAPVAGSITEVNKELEADPARINSDPYETAWMFKIRVSNPAEVDQLKDASAYAAQIGAA